MIFITILNTIAILVIFFKLEFIKITIRKDKTFYERTLLGYDVWVQKFHFRIPIRHKHKTEVREEVRKMISEENQQNRIQKLSAMFSWLRTWEQVYQFEKDYSVVDRKFVEKLISNFKPKC